MKRNNSLWKWAAAYFVAAGAMLVANPTCDELRGRLPGTPKPKPYEIDVPQIRLPSVQKKQETILDKITEDSQKLEKWVVKYNTFRLVESTPWYGNLNFIVSKEGASQSFEYEYGSTNRNGQIGNGDGDIVLSGYTIPFKILGNDGEKIAVWPGDNRMREVKLGETFTVEKSELEKKVKK